jgi:hypothetical protein
MLNLVSIMQKHGVGEEGKSAICAMLAFYIFTFKFLAQNI